MLFDWSVAQGRKGTQQVTFTRHVSHHFQQPMLMLVQQPHGGLVVTRFLELHLRLLLLLSLLEEGHQHHQLHLRRHKLTFLIPPPFHSPHFGARCRRLLTDEDPALRERLIQVLFQGDKFQWARLTNLIQLAKEGGSSTAAAVAAGTSSRSSSSSSSSSQLLLPASRPASPAAGAAPAGASASAVAASSKGSLDLSDTVRDAARLLLLDEKLRRQVIMALTEDNRLHVSEVRQVLAMLQGDVNPTQLVGQVVRDLPSIGRQAMLSWADRVLV
jgi:hypothetical protein